MKDLVTLNASEVQSEENNTAGSEDESIAGTEDDISAEDLDKARIEARLVSERIQRIVQGAVYRPAFYLK